MCWPAYVIIVADVLAPNRCQDICNHDTVTMVPHHIIMRTASNGSVTGPLWGESTGHHLIYLIKASDFWFFHYSAPEQKIEQTIETPGIWDAITLIMMSM